MKWEAGFPTEEGHYWFYGYLFGLPWRDELPRMEQLQVRQVSNGLLYIAASSIVDQHKMLGFWQPNPEPDVTGLADQLLAAINAYRKKVKNKS